MEDILAIASLWNVMNRSNKSVTYDQVAESFQQSQYATLDINHSNVVQVIRAIAEKIS